MFVGGISENNSQKNKDAAETIKLNGSIRDEEEKINALYTEIGKIYFETHSESFEPEFEQLITNIKESKENIEIFAKQILEIETAPRCPKCNNRITENASFCITCGFKMNSEEDSADAEVKPLHCMKCGAPVSESSIFCSKCGAKIESVPAPAPVSVPEVKFCQKCGKQLTPNAKFCTGCGSAL